MSKLPSKEAIAAWNDIQALPEYKNADLEGKKAARAHWRQSYGLDEAPKVDLRASGAEVVTRNQHRTVENKTPVPVRRQLKPQVPQSRADLIPDPAPPVVTGDTGNAFLAAYSKLAGPTAMRAAGRDPLPPGTVRPFDNPAMDTLTDIPAGVEQLTAAVGATLIPGIGPAATQAIVQPILRAPQYAEALRNNQMTQGQVQDAMATDAISGALFPMLDRYMPGGTIGKSLLAEGTQSLAQAEIDAMGKGQQPSLSGILADTTLGFGLRGATGGLRPEAQQVRDFGEGLGAGVTDLFTPRPGGLTAAEWAQRNLLPPTVGRQPQFAMQRGAIDFTPKPDPNQPQQRSLSPEAQAAWDAAGGQRPPQPPGAAAAAGGAGEPPRPPSSTGAPAPDAPTPPPGQFPPTPPTPAMQRVFGDDVANLRNEPRQAAKDIAEALDNPARPEADPAAIEAATIKADDYYNFRRAGLSPEVEQAMRQRIGEVVAENGWNPKQRVGFDQVRAEAAEIDPALLRELADKPPKDGETLHPAVRLAAREHLGAISKEIYDIRRQLESPAIRDEARSSLEDQANRLETDAKRLLDVLIPTRSQDGRNLAYHAIIARNGFDPSYWVGRAQKLYRGDLPTDVRGRLMDLAEAGQRAQTAGDEAGVRTSRIELAKELTKLQKSSFGESFMATVKAGLLTAPNTHLKNLTGNASFQVIEEISRLPAALVDMAIANTPGLKRIGSGGRTISGIDPKAIANASTKGIARGWKEAGQIMRHGATDDALSKFELPRELNSGNKWVDWYTNGVFRTLNAEDRLFRQVAIRRSLEDQARVVAINEARAGTIQRKQIRERQATLVEKPTDAMMLQAIGDAEMMTFTNDNWVSTGLASFKRSIAGKPAGDVANVAIEASAPFVKTPTNIIARLMDYLAPIPGVSVGGVIRGGLAAKQRLAEGRKLFSALTPAEQRGVSQAIGRGAVGWGLVLFGKYLAAKGLATGTTAEEESGVRGANQIAGRQEGAIKAFGRWWNISGMAPIGQLITVGATFHEQGERHSNDPTKALGKMAAAGAQVMLDQPMLQGAENLLDVKKDPLGQGGRLAASYGSMLVPSAVSAVADQFDDKARQRFDKTAGFAENFGRGIMSRLPGARNQLEEQVDPFGNSLEQSPLPVLDFLRSTGAREDSDPFAKELVRLKVDVRPPAKKLDFKGPDGKATPYQLSPAEHNEYAKIYGHFADEELAAVFSDPEYAGKSDEDKNHDIEKALSKAKRDATAEFKTMLGEVLGIPSP
jgi:hypothetical protein